MEIFVITIMLTSLYFLYRIAFPKQPAQTGGEVSTKETKTARSVMGKSRFVLPEVGQPATTPATSEKVATDEKNAYSFAAENQEQRSAVIPADKLDEVFENEPNPEDLEISEDDEDGDDEINPNAEDEDDGMNRIEGVAEGLNFEDLQQVAQVVKEQPETVSKETGDKIAGLEHTDVMEALVSGDEGKMNWIQSVINRHYQNVYPDTESEDNNGDYDVTGFLSKTIKR